MSIDFKVTARMVQTYAQYSQVAEKALTYGVSLLATDFLWKLLKDNCVPKTVESRETQDVTEFLSWQKRGYWRCLKGTMEYYNDKDWDASEIQCTLSYDFETSIVHIATYYPLEGKLLDVSEFWKKIYRETQDYQYEMRETLG